MDMNAKENYLNALQHKPTEWIPVDEECLVFACAYNNEMENTGLARSGKDWFGVTWVGTDSTGGNVMPDSRYPVLSADDICDWRDIVTIPDPDTYHWEEDAEVEMQGIDRNEKCVDYFSVNGPYERLAAIMTFEEALVAMAEEPEAVSDLLAAIADYKIKCLENVARVYHPDTFTMCDDVCTQKSPFMSPDTYRELIKPQHARIVAKAKELGMIPVLHCCGKADSLVEDFIDEGWEAWCSVQPCNDIAGILDRYGDRLTIVGGYDTNGLPGMTGDEEIITAEVDRCLDTYGGKRGYVFSGFILNPSDVGGDIYASYSKMAAIAMDKVHEKAGVCA